MKLPPLTKGRIIRRYKRFLAEIELADGRLVTAHCPNTGRMTSCWAPGAPVEISFSDNPKRKLPWTLERVDMGAGWVGVNTARTNDVVAEAVSSGRLILLQGYHRLQREVACKLPGHPRSRLDFKLSEGDQPDALIEVKNVTLLQDQCLCFPDAVSTRATKHLDLLQGMVSQGLRGVLVFAVNRPEGRWFSPADDIDPTYGQRLRAVVGSGVEIVALRVNHTVDGMVMGAEIPVRL